MEIWPVIVAIVEPLVVIGSVAMLMMQITKHIQAAKILAMMIVLGFTADLDANLNMGNTLMTILSLIAVIVYVRLIWILQQKQDKLSRSVEKPKREILDEPDDLFSIGDDGEIIRHSADSIGKA